MDANKKITFTTIEGLMRHAIALKRATGCQHSDALDFVAKLGGYTNYQHAFRALSGR